MTSNWKQILRSNFVRWDLLADYLELSVAQRETISKTPHFPLNLPQRLARKIVKGTLADPLLRQFLPTTAEENEVPGFGCDPVGDKISRKGKKLLHKYEGRVLLICTSACAMHCRFCFRQNFDYETQNNSFEEELATIRADSSIREVILSGGDPLSLSDRTLNKLLGDISGISHVKRIRIHTRFPIGIPERIDESFLQILSKVPCQIWFVLHSNHPRELDDEVLSHLKALQKIGVVLLNQSVLLKGVNDDLNTLKQLCERLVDNGIVPYYLHQLDRVKGAAHFEVSENIGRDLIQKLASELSGYAVPKYVREDIGKRGKTLL